MTKSIKLFFILCFSLLYGLVIIQEKVTCQNKDEEKDFSKYKNVEIRTDIIFGKGGEIDLKLDLFLPKNGKPPYAGIIFIHGGGWRGLSKEYLREWGYYFADRGYVSVSINYRLSGEAKCPAAVEDCKCAVRWMRANAKEYGIDEDKIAVFGESAGGHLAGMLGTTGGVVEFEGNGGYSDYSSNVNLVFPVYGVFDFTERIKDKSRRSELIEEFIGCSYENCPEIYKKASPINYVDKSDPPFLIFHSTGDSVVPFQQSVIFEQKLKEAGVPVEFSITYGGKHGYALWSPNFEPTCKQMEYFLKKYFK